MRVFKDVGLFEHLGSGMGRILKVYDKSIFKFEDNFLIVTFPFEEVFSDLNLSFGNDGNENGNSVGNDSNKNNSEKILELIKNNPKITLNNLASQADLSKKTISREIKLLQENTKIKRVSSSRADIGKSLKTKKPLNFKNQAKNPSKRIRKIVLGNLFHSRTPKIAYGHFYFGFLSITKNTMYLLRL